MRTYGAILLVLVLFVLAISPWAVSYCAPQPLLPEDFQRERAAYETAADFARNATLDWERKAPSTVKAVPIGTLEVTDEANAVSSLPITSAMSIMVMPSSIANETPVASGTVSAVSTAIVAEPQMTSIVTVRTLNVVTDFVPVTVTHRIIVRSEISSSLPSEMPTVQMLDNNQPSLLPATPTGMVDIEDVITEEMLTNQLQQDADVDSLPNITITLMPTGISGTSVITFLRGIEERIDVSGTLTVENSSLIFHASSIRIDGIDKTERYRGQLESSVNSSLYKLLPQRYVQSYQLADGEVRVYSKVRP